MNSNETKKDFALQSVISTLLEVPFFRNNLKNTKGFQLGSSSYDKTAYNLPIKIHDVEKIGFFVENEKVYAFIERMDEIFYNNQGLNRALRKSSVKSQGYEYNIFLHKINDFCEELSDYAMNNEKALAHFETIFSIYEKPVDSDRGCLYNVYNKRAVMDW